MRIAAAVIVLGSLAYAQEARMANGYKIQVAVQETEGGKRVAVRSYALQLSETRTGKLTITTRMPVPAGNGQFQFVEAVLSLNARVDEVAGQTVLDSTVQMTVPVEGDARSPVSTRQFTTSVVAPVTPGKAAPITEFDDVASKRHFVIEATVTRLK
ncbi:MAG: hypothetical protein M1436_06610 [Acidobacteria bacterium]|nr:hypothetical protein [Acidobacteriota bacterium]